MHFCFAIVSLILLSGCEPAANLPYKETTTAKSIKRIDMLNFSGDMVSFDSLTGKPAVIYFWASWCKPCYKTLETLDAVSPEIEQQISIVTVSLDDDAAEAKQVLTKLGVSGTAWFAVDGTKHLNQQDFGNTRSMLPFALALDKHTQITATHITFDNPQQTEQLLIRLAAKEKEISR